MTRIIIITLAAFSFAACALGAEERRGATDTTEAQLPASPELYTEAEFDEASAEITRYDDTRDHSAKAAEDARRKAK